MDVLSYSNMEVLVRGIIYLQGIGGFSQVGKRQSG